MAHGGGGGVYLRGCYNDPYSVGQHITCHHEQITVPVVSLINTKNLTSAVSHSMESNAESHDVSLCTSPDMHCRVIGGSCICDAVIPPLLTRLALTQICLLLVCTVSDRKGPGVSSFHLAQAVSHTGCVAAVQTRRGPSSCDEARFVDRQQQLLTCLLRY